MKPNRLNLLNGMLLASCLWLGVPQGAIAQTTVTGLGGTITFLAVDPQTPSTLYAVGDRVFKSTDGGDRWFAIGADVSALYVSRIVIDPMAPGTLYATTRASGIFKSTDGGESWVAANAGLTGRLVVNALVIDPQASSVLYASLSEGGLYKSVDGGGTWAPINNGISDFQLDCSYCREVVSLFLTVGDPGPGRPTGSPRGSGRKYDARLGRMEAGERNVPARTEQSTTILYARALGGTFRSFDGGQNWRFVAPSIIAVHPRIPAIVYKSSCGTLYKSLNAGKTWHPTGLTQADCSDFWILNLISDPATPTTLYALTVFRQVPLGTTLFKSTDGAATWKPIADANVVTRAVALDPRTPSTVYAGLYQEGILKSTDGGGGWLPVNSGLPPLAFPRLVVNPVTPTTIYGIMIDRLYRSVDGGTTWRSISSGLISGFLSFLSIDPNFATTMYVVGNRNTLYRTTDAGETWRQVFSVGIDLIYSLLIDTQTPGILYVVHNSPHDHYGSISKSINGGDTWGRTRYPGGEIRSVTLDSNSNTLTIRDWRGKVYTSSDGGSTWSPS